MENKMTFGGVGPKMALLTAPYLILALVVMTRDPLFLKLDFIHAGILKTAGYLLVAAGLLFYLATIRVFLSDFKKGILVTRGTFSLCRNPIYASFLIFIVPGLALIFQSGMLVTIAVVLYLNFKLSIHGENIVLRRKFGEEYERYEKQVNEVIPIPVLKK